MPSVLAGFIVAFVLTTVAATLQGGRGSAKTRVNALIVVDVQNDFITGSLPVEGAEDIVPIVNELLAIPFDVVVFTRDWHPADHISFLDNVNLREIDPTSKVKDNFKVGDVVTFDVNGTRREQILWPRHCVQNGEGAQLHKNLTTSQGSIVVDKGTKPDIDSYSAFWDNEQLSETSLRQELRSRNVTDIYVCGLAYDYCVGETALDGVDIGFGTVVIDDASRGVSNSTTQAMKTKLQGKGVLIRNSDQISSMVIGPSPTPSGQAISGLSFSLLFAAMLFSRSIHRIL